MKRLSLKTRLVLLHTALMTLVVSLVLFLRLYRTEIRKLETVKER